MHTFTTRKDAFKQVRNQLLAPLIGIDVVILIVLMYVLPPDTSAPQGFAKLIVTTVIVVGGLTISAVSAVRRQKKIYETFKLTISEDSVTREQSNTPIITIEKNKVREIRRFSNGTICIIGDSKLDAIGIPAQVERPKELERLLSEIKPLTVKNYGTGRAYLQAFGVILTMGILCGGMLSDNRIIFSISSMGMCAFIVTGFVLAQRSKNIDKRIKRLYYFAVIPLIAIMSYVIMNWL